MKKIIFFCLLICVFPDSSFATDEDSGTKRILLVSSISGSCRQANDELSGFRRYFQDNNIPVAFDIIELNVGTNCNLKVAAEDINYLRQRVGSRRYDLVAASGNTAADLFIDGVVELSESTPFLFFGYIEYPIGDPRLRRKGIAGVIEPQCFADTVVLGTKMLPSTRTVALITDATASGINVMRRVEDRARQLPGIKVISLNGGQYSTDEMLEKIAALPDDSFVVFDRWASTKSEPELQRCLLRRLFMACKAPIFGNPSYAPSANFLGGIHVVPEQHGREAAAAAGRILTGEPPENIGVITGTCTASFDSTLLGIYNIARELLPVGARLINEPVSFFDRYHLYINWAVVALVTALLMWIRHLLSERRVRRRTEGIFDALPVQVMVLDQAGNIRFFRAGSGEKDDRKVVGGQLAGALHHAFGEKLNDIFADGKPRSFEYDMGDRHRRAMLLMLPKVVYGEITALAVSMDITELYMVQRELEQALARAEQAARAKTTFLATISHELRTPLNSVIGFSELLEADNLSKDEREEAVKAINIAGNSLLSLINDVLDLSKIEADRLKIVPEDTDLADLADEMRAVFAQRMTDKNLEFIIELPPELPVFKLDSLRLRQIMLNLIGNAIKFTDTGNVKLSIAFSSKPGKLADLRIAVIDTGRGVLPEKREAIFRPFEQQDSMRDSGICNGTGLGLAIVERLAKAMGGKVALESEVGKGSSFTLELFDVPFHTAVPRAHEATHDPVDFTGVELLVVDDTELNLRVLAGILRNLKATVHTARSAREAIEFLEKNPKLDMVLTDMWMPEMNGSKLAVTIRNNPKLSKLKIVAVTADAEYLPGREFDGVLLKPVTFDSVTKALAPLVA
ncbi:MAG: ATP-binding protein [Victivallaceae bacterium]|nr:ATP-binding protein [Victivallaceae bacterium]